ncbi:MAG: hypothetical protein ABI191_03055 [Rhizomicrobium sp.]
MKKTIPLAVATMLLTATGVFAQAAMSPGGTMTKSTAPQTEGMKTEGMKADASADAATAKPKAHHRMAKNETALNASEAETTKQLNMEQSQKAPGAR